MFSTFYIFFVFLHKEVGGSRRQHVPFFAHLDFLQSPHQIFILPSYAKVSIVALVDLCSILSFPNLRIRYHLGVEMFIDDEAK
jgi:hypothetical protein